MSRLARNHPITWLVRSLKHSFLNKSHPPRNSPRPRTLRGLGVDPHDSFMWGVCIDRDMEIIDWPYLSHSSYSVYLTGTRRMKYSKNKLGS